MKMTQQKEKMVEKQVERKEGFEVKEEGKRDKNHKWVFCLRKESNVYLVTGRKIKTQIEMVLVNLMIDDVDILFSLLPFSQCKRAKVVLEKGRKNKS